METNKLVAGIVAAAIAVIVLAGVLMPALNNATETHETFKNDGFYRMKEIKNGDTWAKSSGGTWTYNTDMTISYTEGSFNMVLGDTWCVRANGTARGTFVSGSSTGATVISADDMITISGSGITSTDTPAISGYGGYNNGNFVLTKPTVPVYVNSETQIYATGTTEITGSSAALFHIEGTIKDGVTITSNSVHSVTPYDTIETDNVKINYSAVDGYIDLYKLESITFDITAVKTVEGTPTTYTGSAVYNSYVVPYEVTAEKAQHLSDPMTAILNVIPIIIIVAVLLGVVAIFIIRRE